MWDQIDRPHRRKQSGVPVAFNRASAGEGGGHLVAPSALLVSLAPPPGLLEELQRRLVDLFSPPVQLPSGGEKTREGLTCFLVLWEETV